MQKEVQATTAPGAHNGPKGGDCKLTSRLVCNCAKEDARALGSSMHPHTAASRAHALIKHPDRLPLHGVLSHCAAHPASHHTSWTVH